MSAPATIDYGLLDENDSGPSGKAVILRNFMRVPLHVQAQCRLRSYRDHLPDDLESPVRDPDFHYYEASEQVIGLFGDIPVHSDKQSGQTRRLTTGLTLVNDGRTQLVMGERSWSLPVGSLYIMDSAHPHRTESRNKNSLFSFVVVDWNWQASISTQQLRRGMRDTLRKTFEFQEHMITTVWNPDE